MLNQFDSIVKNLSGTINILAVDDDIAILETMHDLLSSPIINLVTANSALEAQKIISSKNFKWHTWIFDIAMEEERSGLNLLKNNPGFPFVIMLSGMHSMSIATEAMESGALKVFDKDPTKLDFLLETLCKVSALGFLINGQNTKYLNTYTLLLENSIATPDEWAERAFITIRQLERVCHLHNELTPRYQIPLYYVLFHLLTLGDEFENSLENQMGYGKMSSYLEFFYKHWDTTYLPWLNKNLKM